MLKTRHLDGKASTTASVAITKKNKFCSLEKLAALGYSPLRQCLNPTPELDVYLVYSPLDATNASKYSLIGQFVKFIVPIV